MHRYYTPNNTPNILRLYSEIQIKPHRKLNIILCNILGRIRNLQKIKFNRQLQSYTKDNTENRQHDVKGYKSKEKIAKSELNCVYNRSNSSTSSNAYFSCWITHNTKQKRLVYGTINTDI